MSKMDTSSPTTRGGGSSGNNIPRRPSETPLLLRTISSAAPAAAAARNTAGGGGALEMSSPPSSQEFRSTVSVVIKDEMITTAIYGAPAGWSDDDGVKDSDSNKSSQQQHDHVSVSSSSSSTSSIRSNKSSSPASNKNHQNRKKHKNKNGHAGYWTFLRSNRPFCLYLASYITNHLGEWLTYLAALTAIEEIQRQQLQQQQLEEEESVIITNEESSSTSSTSSSSQTAISILVVVRLMSTVLVSPLGGVLADAVDRRRVMMGLDLLGAVAAFGYVLAVHLQSIPCIYVAACLQEVLSGLYEPSRSAIVPLLVPDVEDDLELATILTGMAWSVMAAVGSASGGFVVAFFGTRGCFVIDSVTYIISALLMALVPGNFNVSSLSLSTQREQEQHQQTKSTTCTRTSSSSNSSSKDNVTGYSSTISSLVSPLSILVTTIRSMIIDGVVYLYASFFGALVLVKFSILWLTLDVVNVSFAERHAAAASSVAANANASMEGQEQEDDKTPIYLGFLFFAIGVGCLLGPVVAERYTDMNRPITLQVACIISIAISSFSCLVMSLPGIPFWLLCILTGIRAIGVSTAWIDATLLLQKFAAPHMLGRVLSLDMMLALMAESSSAMLAGRVQDAWGWTPEQVCRLLGVIGCIQLLFWLMYHARGGGAASVVAAQQTKSTTATAVDSSKGTDFDYNDNNDPTDSTSDSEHVAFLTTTSDDNDVEQIREDRV